MKLDLHCHSKYSLDNCMDPQDLVCRAIEMGLDGVCFTEHFSFEASWPVDRLSVPPGFLVFRGVESLPIGGISWFTEWKTIPGIAGEGMTI